VNQTTTQTTTSDIHDLTMMVPRTSFQFLAAVGMVMMSMGLVMADQIVYLDRPSNGPTWEPFFNPKVVNASFGDKITFIARLDPVVGNAQSGVVFFLMILSIVFRPYELGIFGNQLLRSMCL
jgi:hypothetical protein